MKKLVIAMAVVLCLFTVTVVGITGVGIILTNSRKTVEDVEIKTPQKKEPGIDLDGTFDGNDLTIETLTKQYRDVEIKIPQINGLKNYEVQRKINDDMITRIYAVLDKYPHISYGDFSIRANFANTVSISYSVSSDSGYETLGLNYELLSGERLKLEDIFAQGTDILSMAREGFFFEYVMMGEYDSENDVMLYNENEFYKAIKTYMNNDDKSFCFSPAAVYLYNSPMVATIKMIDYPEDVTIYSKFMTDESIFEDENIGFEDAFTCSDINYEYFDLIEYGYGESNLWYDITAWPDYIDNEFPEDKREKFEFFKDELYKVMVQESEKYKEMARQNPDKFYVVLERPNIMVYAPNEKVNDKYKMFFSNAAGLSNNVHIYEMDKSYFESDFKDDLVSAYRNDYFVMSGGAYIYCEEDPNVTETVNTVEKLYNYVDGKEYRAPDEIFNDPGYREKLEYYGAQWLEDAYDYDFETARELSAQMIYEISAYGGIKAYMPGEELSTTIYFDKFDRSTLDFFD